MDLWGCFEAKYSLPCCFEFNSKLVGLILRMSEFTSPWPGSPTPGGCLCTRRGLSSSSSKKLANGYSNGREVMGRFPLLLEGPYRIFC